jgi:diguanylate cyclase
MPPTELTPFRDFPEACNAVLRCLQGTAGFAAWLVTRTNGDDWIVLAARDDSYGIAAGQVFRWSDSFCYHMVRGAPRIAPDSTAVPEYANAPIGKALAIGAYVGIPLMRNDGSLFGTLCAIDPSAQPPAVAGELSIIEIMGRILATMLEADLSLQERQRELEHVRTSAETDDLTGLLNRKGWNAALAAEETRSRRFGHPAAVAVLDLDDLKKMNDAEGHAQGDALLQRAAALLRENVSARDVVARVGGDEFAILFPEVSREEVPALQSRIESAFHAANICVSSGFTLWDYQSTLADTMNEADRAMYRHKALRKTTR